MDNKSWIWLILCATGVTGKFQVEPLHSTVLKGSDARFKATVEGPWEVMTWNVRGFLVLTVPRSGNISSSSKQFSASFCSADDTSCVAFTVHNTSRSQAGLVTCTIQGEYGSKSANLHVQESGTVKIKEGIMEVHQDEEVEFNCEASAWFPQPLITWNLNGHSVESSLYNITHVAHEDSFNSSSLLKFRAVKNSTIACLVTLQTMTKPLSSSVFLVVVPKPPDWTVLIALVCSFGGCALLVLFILGVMFCYRRKKEKESNYQDEMTKRVRTLSQLSGMKPPGQEQGQDNAGYAADGQTSVAPSDLTDSDYRFNSNEILDAVYHRAENDSKTSYIDMDEGFRKHRHATTV
ncbi:immunoglobulin superfamily member 5 isoform X1 [Stigmatopora argus]